MGRNRLGMALVLCIAALAAIVAVVALVASPIGAWVSIRTHPALLMKILAVVVILAALRMAATAILG